MFEILQKYFNLYSTNSTPSSGPNTPFLPSALGLKRILVPIRRVVH